MPERDIAYTTPGLDITAFFQFILDLFKGGEEGAQGVLGFFIGFWHVFSIISFMVSALLLFGIIYAKIRWEELHHAQIHRLDHLDHEYAHASSHGSKNQRWEDALAHITSDNPNDWRLAIIEADIMLEELLNSLGFPGLTIGDKLKRASPQFFKTIEDAWTAHKVRNDIAHRGTDFVLTQRIAKETLEHYRRVFDEFDII